LWLLSSLFKKEEMKMAYENLKKLRAKFDNDVSNARDELPREIAHWISADRGRTIIDALLKDLEG
jgi:hypothetical protein